MKKKVEICFKLYNLAIRERDSSLIQRNLRVKFTFFHQKKNLLRLQSES